MLLTESTTIQNTGRLDSTESEERIHGLEEKSKSILTKMEIFTTLLQQLMTTHKILVIVRFTLSLKMVMNHDLVCVDEVSSILLSPENTISESAPEPTAGTIVRLCACMHKP